MIYPELPTTYVLRGLIHIIEDKRVADLRESLLIYCPADEKQRPCTSGIEQRVPCMKPVLIRAFPQVKSASPLSVYPTASQLLVHIGP